MSEFSKDLGKPSSSVDSFTPVYAERRDAVTTEDAVVGLRKITGVLREENDKAQRRDAAVRESSLYMDLQDLASSDIPESEKKERADSLCHQAASMGVSSSEIKRARDDSGFSWEKSSQGLSEISLREDKVSAEKKKRETYVTVADTFAYIPADASYEEKISVGKAYHDVLRRVHSGITGALQDEDTLQKEKDMQIVSDDLFEVLAVQINSLYSPERGLDGSAMSTTETLVREILKQGISSEGLRVEASQLEGMTKFVTSELVKKATAFGNMMSSMSDESQENLLKSREKSAVLSLSPEDQKKAALIKYTGDPKYHNSREIAELAQRNYSVEFKTDDKGNKYAVLSGNVDSILQNPYIYTGEANRAAAQAKADQMSNGRSDDIEQKMNFLGSKYTREQWQNMSPDERDRFVESIKRGLDSSLKPVKKEIAVTLSRYEGEVAFAEGELKTEEKALIKALQKIKEGLKRSSYLPEEVWEAVVENTAKELKLDQMSKNSFLFSLVGDTYSPQKEEATPKISEKGRQELEALLLSEGYSAKEISELVLRVL